MRKLIVFALIGTIFVLGLTACSSKATQTTEPENNLQITGGYTMTEQKAVTLPEDVQAGFNKAAAGETLIPVALIAQQVVAGTNDMILCQKDGAYRMIVIYRDLQGNAQLSKNTEFKLTDYTNTNGEAKNEVLAGGWSVPSDVTKLPLPDNANDAFDKASSGLTGSNIEPMALLGTQVVAGTNYATLCRVTPVTPDAIPSIQVVTVYADLQGNASFTSFCPIDPSKYNS